MLSAKEFFNFKMSVLNVVWFFLVLVLVHTIYVPPSVTNELRLKNLGIKTISWQSTNRESPSVTVHHNYSRVYSHQPNRHGESYSNTSFQKYSRTTKKNNISELSPNTTEQDTKTGIGNDLNLTQNSEQHSPTFYQTSANYENIYRINDHLGEFVNIEQNFQNLTKLTENANISAQNLRQSIHKYDKQVDTIGGTRQFSNIRSIDKAQGRVEEQRTNIYVKPRDAKHLFKERAEVYKKCPKNATGQFVYELSCNQFLNCWKGRGYVQNCAPGTLFNPLNLECDFKDKVTCISGPRTNILEKAKPLSGELQAKCPQGFSGLIPHYTDCAKFINCNNGVEVTMDCAPGTLFDIKTNMCEFPYKAVCVGDDKKSVNINKQNVILIRSYNTNASYQWPTQSVNDHLQGFSSHSDQQTAREGKTYGQQQSINNQLDEFEIGQESSHSSSATSKHQIAENQQSSQIVGTDNSGLVKQTQYNRQHKKNKEVITCPLGAAGLFPHPTACDKFLNCANGLTYIQDCAPGTLFNPALKVCDFPYNVDCKPTSSDINLHNHNQVNEGNNNYILVAALNEPYSLGISDNYCYYHTGFSVYPKNCSRFLYCDNSILYIGICSEYTYFNPSKQVCEENIDCNSISPQYGANQEVTSNGHDWTSQVWLSGTQYEYFQLKEIGNEMYTLNLNNNYCEFNDGFSVHPKNCSNFLLCTHGKLLLGVCNSNTFYNPLKKLCAVHYNCEHIQQQGSGQKYDIQQWSTNEQYEGFILTEAGNEMNILKLDIAYCQFNNGFSAHPKNCSKFLLCQAGKLLLGICKSQRFYNPTTRICDKDYKCKYNDINCLVGRDGLYPHPTICSKFVNCVSGYKTIHDCAAGTLFNPLLKVCDFANNVKCVDISSDQLQKSQTQQNQNEISQSNIDQQQTKIKWDEETDQQTNWQTNEQVHQQTHEGTNRQIDQQTDSQTDQITNKQTNQQVHEQKNQQTDEQIYQETNQQTDQHVIEQANRQTNLHVDLQTDQQSNLQTNQQIDQQVDQQTYQQIDQQTDQSQNQCHDQWNQLESQNSQCNDQWPKQVNTIQSTTEEPTSHDSNSTQTSFPTTDTNADYVFEVDDLMEATPSERLHNKATCETGDFHCTETICIQHTWVCDNFQDCPDGEDEKNCGTFIEEFSHTSGTKLAVKEELKYENITLTLCAKYCIESKGFTCKAFNYRNIDNTCFILATNIGLSGSLFSLPTYDYYEYMKYTINCSDKLVCPNKKCIGYDQICDGINDCVDRFDEKGCSATELGFSVQLVGSKKSIEGAVQVTVFGKTGFVCDDMFNIKAANVLCKELGFILGAAEVKGNSYFTQNLDSNATFMMDDVVCTGEETSIRDCDFNDWGNHNCMEKEVAGVICKTPKEVCVEDYWKCETNNQCIPLAFLCDEVEDCSDNSDEASQYCDAPVEMKLVGGKSNSQGRVEIKYHGTWGTICDDDFNDDAAKVICRYLGYKGPAHVKKDGYFGPGKGPIWLDQVFCQGNETTIEDCIKWDWGAHNCEHEEDVGVICNDYDHAGIERKLETKHEFLSLPDRCGYRNDNIFLENNEVQFRVLKSLPAQKGHYPWQASIRVKGISKPSHWCGAVVISQKFVLTAAHCLHGFTKGGYIVVAGDYDIAEDEGTEQHAYIDEFYIHQNFRKGTKMNNDIALIRLKGRGFNITSDVQPICLPDADFKDEAGLNCTVSGFGSTLSGRAVASKELRAGWIPIQSSEVCKMPHVYGKSITDGMFCAGYLDGGVDACDGDSGGPLACIQNGAFTLIGMTSWGQHCGEANKPGVYVKIAHYRRWIDEILKKHG